VWPTPLLALLFAERCTLVTGDDSDFVLNITTFYTGQRWSEVMGLGPKCLSRSLVNINWKLYELNGRFYRGRPKDGSIRDADIPPFLGDLLEWQLDTHPDRKCSCRNVDAPWCPGMEYVFLTPDSAHHRRSNYSSRVVRPAADAWYPGREGRYGRPSMPVLVDMRAPWPGVVMPPWLSAVPGESYAPPTGRCDPARRPRRVRSVPGLRTEHATAPGRHAHQAPGRGRPVRRFAAARGRTARARQLAAPAARSDRARAAARSPGSDGRPSGWATKCRACAESPSTSCPNGEPTS